VIAPSLFENKNCLSFAWVPVDARAVLFVWAQDAFAVHVAAFTRPFMDLPDDCAGDDLVFIELKLTTRERLLGVLEHCSSQSAKTWVREVTAAAVAVSTNHYS